MVNNLVRLGILFSFISFSSCLSEKQKRINEKIDSLDALFEKNEKSVKRFFKAVANFEDLVIQKEFPETRNFDTVKFNYLAQHFDSIVVLEGQIQGLKPKPVFLENMIPIFLNTRNPNKEDDAKIQNIQWLDKQLVWKIYDRMTNKEWDNEIANPTDWQSIENIEKAINERKNVLLSVSSCNYLAGIENLSETLPKIASKREYEPGTLFSVIHLYDVQKERICLRFVMFNRNSGIIFADTTNTETMISDLREYLCQEPALQLKRKFEKTIEK